MPRTLVTIIAVAAVVAAVVLAVGWAVRMPTDDHVRARFSSHQDAFVQLRDLMLGDRSSAVQLEPDGPRAHVAGGEWVRLNNAAAADLSKVGWDAGRAERYLRLMRGAGVKRVDKGWSTPDRTVAFTVYSAGTVAESMTKQIVWSPSHPSPLAEADDQPLPDNSEVYRPISENWYVRTAHD